ncbi:MAG: HDOD domain-containing protein [Candidatus Eisenbacteria bacterium]|uniref:HDOD domain-containing protein n=1 Tax=Eiseniibacteriota bacterium TaxID=2212470 RepID=A0A948RYB8_UNCEI|nr:HDOD domain-containing protein [Candidatus Eisenbacteria bacterium]MBU1947290.1 HDOD domain-containing protein [Candidatus Eisenbacteria bacterium]MBU2691829.1 HDOD domain-containing protein [Candidatus Eisenbacteria bacterium]
MIHKRLNVVENIPTLPEILTKVMTMVDDPDASAYDIANVISKDPSLVSTILKVVNSPFYGLSRKVSSVGQGVIFLGFRAIRNLVFSAQLLKTFGGPGRNRRFNRKALWKHAIATGAAAKQLALRVEADPETAFLTGLMHDLGCIVLDQYFPEEFGAVLDLLDEKEISLIEAECQIVGIDHAEIGRLICRKWNFPEAMADAIGNHHQPEKAVVDKLGTCVIHVADHIARTLGLDSGLGRSGNQLSPEALLLLDLEDPVPSEILEQALTEYERANIFVGLIT